MNHIHDLISGFTSQVQMSYDNGYRCFHFTGSDIRKRIFQISHLLKSNGLKKEDKVLIWAENSMDWIATFFAVLINGAIVVPIDMRMNKKTARLIAKKVKSKILIKSKYKESIGIKNTININDFDLLLEKESKKIMSAKTAMIIFTSGTTGNPKGVVLTHQNLCANLEALKPFMPLHKDDCVLLVPPFSHVFGLITGLVCFQYRVRLVTLRALKPSTILDVIKTQQITYFITIPRMLEAIKNALASGLKSKLLGFCVPRKGYRKTLFCSLAHKKVRSKFGPRFKGFISGGAPLDETAELFFDGVGLPINQGYGLTETSPVISFNKLDQKKIGSVGQLLSNVRLKFDKGEILVKGPSVFSGYYENKKATENVFRNGWFRTGDCGELIDGFLFIKGRKKDMIVTSEGFNIFPEDIENVLRAMPGVKDAAVIGKGDSGGEEIHAVLILSSGNASDIVKKANQKLDSAQRIQGFTVWKRDFPRTPTLKVKKFALKEMISEKNNPNKRLSKVCEVISRVTGKTKIEPNMILAKDLRLSSIDRVELVTLLEQELNIDIDEGDIDAKTTVRDLEKIAKKKSRFKWNIKNWATGGLCCFIRWIYLRIARILVKSYFEIEVQGTLPQGLEPMLFTANHESNIDGLIIVTALSDWYADNIAIASWAEWYFPEPDMNIIFPRRIIRQLTFYLLTIFHNMFPLSQRKGFLRSIRHVGKLLNEGWNIMIFPEGMRTRDGKMNPFKPGTGLIMKEMKVKAVPIKLEGPFQIMPIGKLWPSRGKIIVKFGKPVYYTGKYADISRKLQDEIRKL